MRKIFSDLIEQIGKQDESVVFLTGDLGFNAFENLQSTLKDRFINTGVAEQNMVGVAAGLASKGYKVFCYSIAPFIVYRCLEQTRVDICLHRLPVYLVGNGGGYGYGIMGATHHAIEDIACLSSMPHMTCWVPAFDEDVKFCLSRILSNKQPAYFRLGVSRKNPFPVDKISEVNHVKCSSAPRVTIITLGPLINNAMDATSEMDEIDIFTVLKLPLHKLDEGILQSVRKSGKLLIIEEHTSRGGMAENISLQLHEAGISLERFKSLTATGYPDELYGNQDFHQKQSGLDSENIKKIVDGLA